jgi:N12 class adenine-specific DNA methylase
MAFEDLIAGADGADEPLSLVSPDLIQARAELKGIPTDISARARQPQLDFGGDDEVVGPAPKVKAPKAKALDFGGDDEVIGTEPIKNPPLPMARPAEADAISGPVPMPQPRPTMAQPVQPTQTMPEVQPLDDAPFRAPSSGMTTNMLTGEEAYAEREANIKAAEEGVTEARARLDVARQRQSAMLAPSTRRGTTGDLQRQAIDAEVGNATENLAQAERGLSEAQRAAPPTQTKLRDAASRFATAVGQIAPDTVGGLARPVDAALDALGIKGGTGTAEKMREFSKNIGIANQPDPARDDEMTAKLGQGAGSAVGFVVTGAIGRAAGGSAAVTSAVTGGAQNAEQYYREADDMGASAYKKALAYVAGGAIGATEGIGLGRMADALEGLDKATAGGVRRYFGLVLKEMGEEGLQEGVQQLLDNIAKYSLYGKDPGDITKDVGSNALVGALLGMGMAGLAGSPALLRGRGAEAGVPVPNQQQITPEEIVRQILGEPSTPPATAPAAATPPAQEVIPPGPKVDLEQKPWTAADGNPWGMSDEDYAVWREQPENAEEVAQWERDNKSVNQKPSPGNITTSRNDVNEPPTPAEAKAAGDETTALLRGYGYTDEQIADMSPNQREQEAAAAKHAGTEPSFGDDDHRVGSKSAPVEVKTAADLKHATDLIEKDYTPAQGEANNRRLGHITWNGLKASLEVEPGGTRRGTNPKTGEEWETKNGPTAYGYFPGFKGADGQDVDVLFGDKPESKTAYVIDELDDKTGKFRQHKVVAATESEDVARAAYLGISSKSEKTLGAITPVTIEQLIDWLHNGDLKAPFLKTKSITLPKETKSDKPLSLLQFIASKGGLSPDPELSAIGLTGGNRMQIPGRKGFFSPVRPTGMTLDQMREAAEEAGYFRGTGEATSTVREFLDAIDGELRGQRKMPEGHEAEASPSETQRVEEENANRDATLAQNRAEIEEMLTAYGMPASLNRDEDIRLAAEIMADEGLPADEALERAAMRNLETDMPVTADEINDTFDFGAFDAVQPGPTQADERPAADESADGERPREEGRPAEEVGDLPDAGQDREGSGKSAAAEEAAGAARSGKEVSDEVVAPAARQIEAENRRHHYAVERATDDRWRELIDPSIEDVHPGDIYRGIQLNLENGGLTIKNARALLKANEDEELPHEEIIDILARSKIEKLQGGSVIQFPYKDENAQGRMWATLVGMEEGYIRKDRKPTRKLVDLIDNPPPPLPPIPEGGEAAETLPAERNDLFVEIEGKRLPLTSYKEASEAYSAAIDATGTTASGRTGPQAPEALIKDSKGKTVGYISYNGRVWSGSPKEFNNETTTLLYDPSGEGDPYAKVRAETGADGKAQLVIPGAEKESQGKQAQRKADERLKPKQAQKPADEGLFGDDSKQTDLLDRARESGPSASEDIDFDNIIDEALDKYAPEKKAERDRTTGAAAKSAAKNVGMGLAEVAKGLDALFSPKGKLGSGPTFDDETYAKAKPFFKAGVAHFAQAGRDIKGMLDELVKHLVQTAGMSREAVNAMRPYLIRFARDVRSGEIDLTSQESDNAVTESDDERSGADSTGAETLDRVPAQPGEGAAGERDAGRGAAGRGDLGAGGDRAAQESGLPGERGAGSGAAEVHPAAGGGSGRRAGARTGGKGSRVSEPPAGTEGSGRELAGPVTPSEAPTLPAINYRITDETELGQGSEATKFRDNIAAIETLKTIEREQRRATPAEQRALARYVGWGGLANAFRDTEGNLKADWQERGEQLESLLTKDELSAARRSTRNAHYTSRTVVDAMWEAARRLGFRGGLALELSSGTGNFLGLVPEQIAGQTRFIAVEYDSLTARIAKALYPQDTVLHSGLHKLPLPEGEAVLNIGNPPFGSESLRFQYSPELNGLSIHNQFFLAGIDALRPGGLQILVVSRFLMDAQDQAARRMLAKKAKLLGAIRLPDTAFKENARTEVVTDIIFLQRLTADEEAEVAAEFDKAKDKNKVSDIPAWVETTAIKVPGGEDVHVNRHFATNRNMVLGTFDRTGSMYGADQVNVTLPKGADLASLLKKAVDRLPKDVLDLHQDVMDATLKRYQTMGESLAIALAGHEVGHVEREDGKLYQISERETPSGGYEPVKRPITPESPWSRDLFMDAEGRWYTLEPKVDEKGAKVKAGARNVYERSYFKDNVVPAAKRLGKAKYDKLSALVDLRDLTKRQLTLEAEDAPAGEMEGNRKKLAAAYEGYVASNGFLNDPGNLRLLNDLPDGALVMALEMGYRAPITHAKAARTGEQAKPASAKPAPIMSRRVVPKYEPATKAESPQDALSITLSEVGHADMDRIAQLLGVSREQAIEQLTEGDNPLVYKDPETGGFETRNSYLSGNVVRKLKAAEIAGLNKNAEALRKVQPERWSAENISAMLGANWITPKVYADFAQHLLGVPARVHYSQITNSFNLIVDDYSREKADQWGTSDITADAILRGILNSRVPKVVREDGEGRRYIDQEATALVSLKAKEMENEFADWVFADTTRRNHLTDIFNEKFNTRVNRQHDGSHLTLPGKVPDEVIKLRRHQKNAVWRGIYERFLLLDHVVGAGKTFTAIARVMERRRMGLSRKPMIVVPNHLVDQWTADVYRLYPGAKVLAAGKNQFDKKNRRRLFAKIATGDWDVIIVPHSSFGFIGIAPETESRFLEEELRLALEAVEEAKEQAAADGIGGRSKPFTVKEAERLVTTIEGRMDRLKKAGRDNMLTFEQMGVDDLTVDEAHEFKNLFYSSRLTGVRGMGDKSGSQKAFDLYNKVRVLRDSPSGTVTFMTGTPISNSAVEMYTMMRYLAAKELAELGIDHFDAWRSQYVSATAKFEPTEAGGLKEVTRLGRNWSNMRALMELYYSFTDAVSQEDINRWYAEDNQGARFPVPKVKTGGRKEVVVKPTAAQSDMLADIVAGFNSLPGISDPIVRNATRLRLMDRARKVSLDVRAANPRAESDEEGGKLDQIADKIADIYDRRQADAGTQLVFIDRSVPSAKGDKKVIKDYDDLIARRDEALAAGDEAKYRTVVEALEKFDANEIETLRAAQAGGWNAYDQLKQNLIERGIPADEIRFVQEANNDAEKKAMFDSVNDGTVRVLIGSTPRMGAGTNVQERLVALHHGDVTWKPSDIEQREGRIIRQGNRLLEKYGSDNFEVDILAYVTERTVDAKMWDLNATKLKMINGIRKYDGAFNMEFEDEDSVGMAEIAALASGDPLLLERVKLMAEIDKLELLERAHRRKMFGVEDTIHDLERAEKQYPAMIEAGRAKAQQINEAIARMRSDAAGRTVEVEGKSFASRLAANEAVEKAIEAAKAGDENARYAINVNGQRVTNKETAEAILNQEIGDPLYIEATIDGEVLRSRSSIGKVLAQKATDLLHKPSDKPVPIGKMLGFRLSLGVYPDVRRLSLTLSDGDATMVDVEQSFAKDAKGFVPQTGRALLDRLESEIEYESEFTGKRLQDKIDEARTRLPALRDERGKPFAKAEELQGIRGRLEEVIKILDERTKAAESNRGGPAEMASIAKITTATGAQARLTPEKRANLEHALTDVVRKITGTSARVRFVDVYEIAPPASWGSYGDGITTAAGSYIRAESLITVALADPAYPVEQTLDTTFHEAFHHLEDKLLTDQELEVLKREDARLREIVKRANGFTDQQIGEIAGFEIRAMAFEYYANRRARGLEPQGLHIGIRRAFERLMDLLRRVRNYLRGLGYQNADDILQGAFDGAYANRAPIGSETGEQASIRRRGIPVSADPPIFSYRDTKPLQAHPDYKAAKAGDVEAAVRFVRDLVKPETVAEARRRFNANTIFAAVSAREATGDNAIPQVLARGYAQAVGAVADRNIVQVESVYHTGAGAMERLLTQPTFAGDVQAGRDYVIVDDVTTMGTTLAAMADHIQSGGGSVVGTITLVTASREGYLAAKRPQLREIERRFGNDIESIFGVQPSSLTADEARYLLNFKNGDDLRGRAATARQARAGRLRAKGLREGPPEEQLSIRRPPGGVSDSVRPQGNLNRFESYEPLPERWQDWWQRPDLNWRDRVWGMIDAAFLSANRALGDRYVDMRRLQAAVELAGRRVNEGINMSLAAVLFEGKTEKRLKDYWLKTWKPVLDYAREQGVSREELHRYLYARHAPERNAHIATINPNMPEGGSGMTDAEAQEIMDAFSAAGKREALERVAQRVDGIVREIRQNMVADQLEHEETIQKWEQTYPHYAPLRGFESGDEDMAQDLQVSRAGRGFDVRGPETKSALGRRSKADDILSNLFLMGERAIIRGEQNRVGRTAMRFMQSNPQPSLYDVSRSERILTDGRTETVTENDIDLLAGERPVTIQRVNRETGLVETVTRVASPFAQNSFAVKVGGHTYYITIKHPGLLTALKNVGVQRLPWLIQAHSWLTRQFAAFRTARNPDFFVPNMLRDIQDAAYTLGAEQRSSLVKNFAANIGTLRTYVAALMGELMERDGRIGAAARRRFADKRGAQLFEEWKKNGGQIAFMGISDMEAAKKEIEAAFNEGQEGIAKRILFAGPRFAKALLKAIEFFNSVIEGGTRLAVYDAGLKAGMTPGKAAELSKESTTNFNRKGIYSPFLNAFYAFFNARVQGATKVIRLLRGSKIARRAAIGLVMAGFVTTLWNLAVSPDDEEKKPEYLRRKYWERERYFILYWPGSKEPFRMPMGYGLQLFWMLGENLAMLSQGKITPAQAAANYLSTIVGAFSPLQAEGSPTDPGTWLRLIMPSIEMPALELTTNEDWRRKPIHPKFEQKGLPHSEQYFTTTSPHAIDVAQFLNRISGGNAFQRGKLDLYPGDLQYVWNFATGGLGQTSNRTTAMFENWLNGVPTPANQVPILRHFVGANVDQTVGESYYEDRDGVQKGMASVRKAMKADINGPQGDDAAATVEDGGNKYGVQQGKKKGTVTSEAEQIFRKADKELKDLREQERAARNDRGMPRAAREQLIKDIRENMRQIQEEARKAYKAIKAREPTF